MPDAYNNELENELMDDVTWPPAPTSPVPPGRKRLGLFRHVGDMPFWALPIIAFGYIAVFTCIYFLQCYLRHIPIVWVDAFFQGPVTGSVPSGFLLWAWLIARKLRRNELTE